MSHITIGRYDHPSITDDCAGWIESAPDDGSSWIIFLDKVGVPNLFWPARDENGGVIGDPVDLQPVTE